MSTKPLLTHYVSEIDQLLQSYDKNHPSLSLSQQKESDKYKRIYRLRDKASPAKESINLWEDF